MFNLIGNAFNKVNLYLKSIFTPRQRDIAILMGVGIISVWIGIYSPLLLGIYAAVFSMAFALVAGFFYFTTKNSIFTGLKELFESDAQDTFIRKTQNNTLTLTEAKWLLLPGLFSDKPSLNDNGALHYAAKHGREDLVQLLIDNGANIKKKYGLDTPLCEAVANNHVHLIKLLFYKERVFSRFNPLGIAITKENPDAFRKLIQLGATDNFSLDEKFNMISYAASNGQLSMLKIYQEEFGNNLLAMQSKNSNLIKLVVYYNRPECLKYLLKNAKASHLQQKGRSLIDEAYIRGYKEIVEILKSKGQKLSSLDVLDKEKRKWGKTKVECSKILKFHIDKLTDKSQNHEGAKNKPCVNKCRP